MKRNVLFLFNTGDVVGGGEISLMEFIFRINQDRYRPFVVCPREGDLVEKLKHRGLSVKLIEMASLRKMRVFKIALGVWRLYRSIRKNQIELVHANGSRCALYATLAARMAGVPVLWHVRVMGRDKWLDSWLSRLSTRIIVISHAVRRRFAHNRRALDKISVIYNGIDLEHFRPMPASGKMRKEFFLENATPLIGMVGRMDLYKDYSTLLHAAPEVLRAFPQAKFLLVGAGELQEKLKETAYHQQIDGSVVFTGQRDDIAEILASLDLFVLSTKSEGFGRALAEAMAMEKPVVATRVGGVDEIVEDGISGLLVSPKDSDSLSHAIVKLLRHPSLARNLGKQGRARIESRFSLPRHVHEMENLYDEVLRSRSA